MKENIILEKALLFSSRMLKFAEYLLSKNQRIIADQVLRSSTSIGANVAESDYAASRADFINKLKIAEKEAGETSYWLRVLKISEVIDEKQFNSLLTDVQELQKLIGTSIKTSKQTL